jgi:hypothetical protein
MSEINALETSGTVNAFAELDILNTSTSEMYQCPEVKTVML